MGRIRVISGGQTGVDMAALDAARQAGLPIGGWCPAGRLNEQGRIPDEYPLVETPSADSRQRTEWNVRDSDATLIISPFPVVSNGTAYTLMMIERHRKPFVVLDVERLDETLIPDLLDWLRANDVRVLNVAGPRESKVPGIYKRARAFLTALFTQIPD